MKKVHCGISFIAFVLISLLPRVASAQIPAPGDFKGVPFGCGAASFLRLYRPSGEWAERGGVPTLSVDKGESMLIVRPPTKRMRDHDRMWVEFLKDSVAGSPADVWFDFSIESSEDLKSLAQSITRPVSERAKFFRVRVEFDTEDLEPVKDALISKYGTRFRTEKKAIMHRFAGEQQIEVYYWDLEELVVTLEPFRTTSRQPLLTIQSKAIQPASREARRREL